MPGKDGGWRSQPCAVLPNPVTFTTSAAKTQSARISLPLVVGSEGSEQGSHG
jgi:hypothetical protein